MKESFMGLNVAVSGLYTAQRNLNTVSHNISNASTTGYSRQVNIQTAAKPLSTNDTTGMIGTGSQVTGTKRLRDTYLDFKYWSENIAGGEWSKKNELTAELETKFNEPSNSGFTKIMDQFYSSLQELSKDPSSSAVRALVRENGVTLGKYFNSLATNLEMMQDDVNDQVKVTVEKINSLGTQIQNLNKQIYTYEINGENANDLRDSRTVLVDELSKLVNINAAEVSYGKLPNGEDDIHFTVTIGGRPLVDHFNSYKLSSTQRENKLNEEDIGNLYNIDWQDGNQLTLTGGELKGLMDVRDGVGDPYGTTSNQEYKGVPYYIGKLNEFVRTFAKAFNEGFITKDGVPTDVYGHVDGYGVDTDGPGDKQSSTGVRFFTIFGEGDKAISSDEFINGAGSQDEIKGRYDKTMTAKNFTVSSDILNDTNKIATSNKAGENGNTNVLAKLLEIRSDDNLFTEGAPEDFIKSLVATLGVDAQQAVTFSENQEKIVKQIDNRRMSVSGVELNEELTNMVKFQQSYKASARMMTTLNQIYDNLINRMGVN